MVVRLLIRRPECFGPALRGEGGSGLLAAIEDAIKISEDPARDGPTVKKERRRELCVAWGGRGGMWGGSGGRSHPIPSRWNWGGPNGGMWGGGPQLNASIGSGAVRGADVGNPGGGVWWPSVGVPMGVPVGGGHIVALSGGSPWGGGGIWWSSASRPNGCPRGGGHLVSPCWGHSVALSGGSQQVSPWGGAEGGHTVTPPMPSHRCGDSAVPPLPPHPTALGQRRPTRRTASIWGTPSCPSTPPSSTCWAAAPPKCT